MEENSQRKRDADMNELLSIESAKKLKTHDHQPINSHSPNSKKRIIKVIPPKSSNNQPHAPFTIAINEDNSKPSIKDPSSVKEAIEHNQLDSPSNNQMIKILTKMEFHNYSKNQILEMIKKEKEKEIKQSIIVNDSRLFLNSHPNYNISLGYITYTGAKSRNKTSNRASDLDLFLCPAFTPKDHFSTIQIGIKAEFLTYRGNVAVRKSALWGTDIYTDDSDIVAMIIHSGHYRPVDAPDPIEKNPDLPSVLQAQMLKSDFGDKSSSSISYKSPISSEVMPIIARADLESSSSTTLLPDHDLNVTLRILPKLIKYTGSTRYGLDSKGWSCLHAGESFIIVKVEKVKRKTIVKRKTVNPISHDFPQFKNIVSTSSGELFLKYSADLLNCWPLYLKKAISSSYKVVANHIMPFTLKELEEMKDCPFWQLKLTKFKCILEIKDKRLIMSQCGSHVEILNFIDQSFQHRILLEALRFDDFGLKVESLLLNIPILGISWV